MPQKGLLGEQWGPCAPAPCKGMSYFSAPRIVLLVRFDAEEIAIKPGCVGEK